MIELGNGQIPLYSWAAFHAMRGRGRGQPIVGLFWIAARSGMHIYLSRKKMAIPNVGAAASTRDKTPDRPFG